MREQKGSSQDRTRHFAAKTGSMREHRAGHVVLSMEGEDCCRPRVPIASKKLDQKFFGKLKGRILAIHSYQLPEIVSLKITEGYEKYLDWIDEEVRAQD
jgi:hypothetical protein